jgi:excinuclease ABC subunit A
VNRSQFCGTLCRTDIRSFAPAISIDQKTAPRNPRSTVGTVTEIYDYLRLLFARIGKPHCPICGKAVEKQSASQIVDRIAQMPENKRIMILSPVVRGKKGEHTNVLEKIRKEGFVRMRIDGEIYSIADEIELDPKKPHTIEIVVDRLVIKNLKPKQTELSSGEKVEEKNEDRSRLADSVEIALRKGEGLITILDADTKEEETYSEKFICTEHGPVIEEIEPRNFSFNSPYGACEACHGLGEKMVIQESRVMPNPRLTIAEGAIVPWATMTSREGWNQRILAAVAEAHGFSMDTPVGKLTPEQREIIMHGTGDQDYDVQMNSNRFSGEVSVKFEGVIPNLERRYKETESDFSRKQIERFMDREKCPECGGARLKKEILKVTIDDKNIIDVTEMSVSEARSFFESIPNKLSKRDQEISKLILHEILNRLTFLEDVGLTYLTLSRSANTLSGGEAQRIRLATQIGSKLQGVLYVLDEPSIGLHQRDNNRLIKTLRGLQEIGNTVLVVEHDEEMMREADWLLEIGPGAGANGGRVQAEGTPEEFMKNPDSTTALYLSGKEEISIPKKRRPGNRKSITIRNARENNLRNVDVELPLGKLIGVTGVSGSGKSSLINRILAPYLLNELNRADQHIGAVDRVDGINALDKAIVIDQSPIGRTPRSNPATYTGVFTDIRELFASTSEAKLRGYKAGRFSFNVKGGRCEACQGDGIVKIEMHFLPDIYVPCDVCNGKRYNPEALEITWRGKNIYDVLEMTVEEAHEFFSAIPSIQRKLETLEKVGLGYVKLGQSATTLSGGEAQRVKLATELSKRSTGKTFYILDEPTTGLHFDDIKKLLAVLNALVDSGNTVLVIEHNLDVIKSCDHLVDIGPEGGNGGGEVVAKGTPEEVAEVKKSFTGQYLKEMLAKK